MHAIIRFELAPCNRCAAPLVIINKKAVAPEKGRIVFWWGNGVPKLTTHYEECTQQRSFDHAVVQ
jgi:hypothetical protein